MGPAARPGERTHNTVARIARETALKPAAHLTCVAATRDEIDDVVRSYWEAGVRHVVALRGDPLSGIGASYEAHPGGYARTCDLVAGIRAIAGFEVSVSAYPERHPESSSFDIDLDALQAKIDAGATRAITQFFFDNDVFLRFVDRARARGINVPIVPASCRCRTSPRPRASRRARAPAFPTGFAQRFEGLENDLGTRKLIAAAVAAEQVLDLVDRGIDEFHFYTMNRADLVYAVCHLLGLRAQPNSEAEARGGLRKCCRHCERSEATQN